MFYICSRWRASRLPGFPTCFNRMSERGRSVTIGHQACEPGRNVLPNLRDRERTAPLM